MYDNHGAKLMNLKETIFAAVDRKVSPFDVPEWGVSLFLRSWTGKDRSALIAHETTNKASHEFTVRVVIASVCNDQGDPIFTDKDIPQLQQKNGLALERIALEALKINGLGRDAVEVEKKD